MSITGSKLSVPLRVDEVYTLLGVSGAEGYDISYICSNQHGRINPAAKYKPVIHSTPGELTAIQRAEVKTDTQYGSVFGVYFGLRMSERSGILHNLHYCALDYSAPVPGVNWARLTDFIGYDHNAIFSPEGVLPDVVYTDIPGGMPVSIKENAGNTTGVTLSDAIKSSTISAAKLDDMYPCILLSKYGGVVVTDSEAYAGVIDSSGAVVKALVSERTGNCTPLAEDGAWYGSFYADTYNNGPDYLTEEGEVLATVFFVRKIQDKSLNLDLTQWTSANAPLLGIGEVFVCPGAIGRRITLKRYYTKGMEAYSFSLNKSDNRWSCTVNLAWLQPKDDVTYRVSCNLYGPTTDGSDLILPIGSGASDFKHASVPGLIELLQMQFPLDVLAIDMPDGKYTLRWSVHNAADKTQLYNSGEITAEMLFAKQ